VVDDDFFKTLGDEMMESFIVDYGAREVMLSSLAGIINVIEKHVEPSIASANSITKILEAGFWIELATERKNSE